MDPAGSRPAQRLTGAPGIVVEGPALELAAQIRELHRRAYERRQRV